MNSVNPLLIPLRYLNHVWVTSQQAQNTLTQYLTVTEGWEWSRNKELVLPLIPPFPLIPPQICQLNDTRDETLGWEREWESCVICKFLFSWFAVLFCAILCDFQTDPQKGYTVPQQNLMKFQHILDRNRITVHGTIVSIINCFGVVIVRFAPLQLHVVQEMKQTEKGKTKEWKEKKEGKEKRRGGTVINENEEKLKAPLFSWRPHTLVAKGRLH